MRAVLRTVALVGVILVGASCGKDSTGTDGAGRFTGSLSGAQTGTKSGTAYYEMSVAANDFSIFGFSSDDQMEFDFIPNGALNGLPATGTYAFGVDDNEYFSLMYIGDESYGSTSGTLTISSSTSRAVRGSFNITYEGGTGGALVFNGTFNASKCPDC